MPPPWERERFEELARKRVAAGSETAETAPGSSSPQAEAGSVEAGAQRERDETPTEELKGAQERRPHVDDPGGDPVPNAKRIDAMLIELAGEEPPALRAAKQVGRGVAALMALAGAAMVALSILFMVRGEGAGPIAGLGGGAIGLVGVSFIGVGIWLWVRSSTDRGS